MRWRCKIKILVVDTLAEPGHAEFNRYFIQALSSLGNTTLSGFSSYLSTLGLTPQVALPENLKACKPKIRFRWNQVLILKYITKIAQAGKFEIVVFLSYENFSFAMAWPSELRAAVFVHNNLDRIVQYRVERWLYRLTPRATIHMVYERGMAVYFEGMGKQSFIIPHPLPQAFVGDVLDGSFEKGLIFAPSGGNKVDVINAFISFVGNRDDFRLVAKGNVARNGPRSIIRQKFNNYSQMLSISEYILLPLDFKFRTSAVFHEAMILGKKIIATPCPMMKALKARYPFSIKIIAEPYEILNLCYDMHGMKEDQIRFLSEHANQKINECLQLALKNILH